ncbi:MAG: preprotein translocase subunit YajC [Syntrophomonadaceae bacterium]
MGSAGNWTVVIIYMALFFGIFYFFLILPRKKQEKQHKEILDSLRNGDKVVTIGGIVGKITKISPERVTLEIDDDVELQLLKKAIAYKTEE